MPQARSQEDEDFIDNLPNRVLIEFRNATFDPSFIENHPALFMNNNWINVTNLRQFYVGRNGSSGQDASAPYIKNEPDDQLGTVLVKSEDTEEPTISRAVFASKTRAIFNEHGQEMYELLDSSDEEAPNPIGKAVSSPVVGIDTANGAVKPQDCIAGANPIVSSDSLCKDHDDMGPDDAEATSESGPSPDAVLDPEAFTEVSETRWDDEGLVSRVIHHTGFQVTRKLKVDHIEYLSELPRMYPCSTNTAYVLDLRGDQFRLQIPNRNGEPGKRLTPNALVKNADQDSWSGGSGASHNHPGVRFFPGGVSIQCRRVMCYCVGVCTCELFDKEQFGVQRRDLDPEPRQAIMEAEKESRCNEGSTALDTTIAKGFNFFVSCNGWSPNFRSGHQSHSLQDGVDESLLADLFAGKKLMSGKEKCCVVIPPHIGLKQEYCHFPHTKDGVAYKAHIIKVKCPATRTMYVPCEWTRYPFVMIVHPKGEPHNHAIPVISKMSLKTKNVYQECVREAGVIGMTVQKVDAAQTTRSRLGTETVAEFDPTLLNNRTKRELLAQVKMAKFPAGTGIEGVYRLFLEDRQRRPEERYIHDVHYVPHENEPDSVIIITFVPSLMQLIHKVKTFEGDFTFKRLILFHEWEMVIWYPVLQRTLTIGRFYTNRQTEENYEILFDRLQIYVESLTGHPIRFKRLVPDGNIAFMMTDMEVAQIIGCCKSIMKQNDPIFSKMTTIDPHRFAPEVTRVCYVHSIRAVKDFEKHIHLGNITKNDFNKLLDFPSLLNNEKTVDEYNTFIHRLGVDEITAWWTHKHDSKDGYLLKCICKGLSPIPPEDLYNTINDTNRGESQHAWTARQTGTGLSPVEGIISARRVDERVAREVAIELQSGVRRNRNNNSTNRSTRAVGRRETATRKAEAANHRASIQDQINTLKADRRESIQLQKDLEAELNAVQGSKGKSKKKLRLDQATSSSSGRVKVSAAAKAKQNMTGSSTKVLDAIATESTADKASPPDPPTTTPNIPPADNVFGIPPTTDPLGFTDPGLMVTELPSGDSFDFESLGFDFSGFQSEPCTDFYNLPQTSSSSLASHSDLNSEIGIHSDYPPSDSYYGSDGGYLSSDYMSDGFADVQNHVASHSSNPESTHPIMNAQDADFVDTGVDVYSGISSGPSTALGNMSDSDFLAMLGADPLVTLSDPGVYDTGYADPLFNIPSPLSSPDRYDQRLPAPSPLPDPSLDLSPPNASEPEQEITRKRRRTADDLALDTAEVCDSARTRRKTNRSQGISGIGDERDVN